MAFALRLMAIPRVRLGRPEDGPVWMMDNISWLLPPTLTDGAQRRAPPAHRRDDRDYVLVLSAVEVAQWHARDKHRAQEGVYASESWQSILGPMMAELEGVLQSVDCPKFFLAQWYEVES